MNIFLPALLCYLLLRVCIRCCDCQPLLRQVQAAARLWPGNLATTGRQQASKAELWRRGGGMGLPDWCRAWWSSTHVATMHNPAAGSCSWSWKKRMQRVPCHLSADRSQSSPRLHLQKESNCCSCSSKPATAKKISTSSTDSLVYSGLWNELWDLKTSSDKTGLMLCLDSNWFWKLACKARL